jgi:hypothetical protein
MEKQKVKRPPRDAAQAAFAVMQHVIRLTEISYMILPVKNKPNTLHITQPAGDTITAYGHVTGPNYLHVTRYEAKCLWKVLKRWADGAPLRRILYDDDQGLQDQAKARRATKHSVLKKRSRAKKGS